MLSRGREDCKRAGRKVTPLCSDKASEKNFLIVERFILYCRERGSAKFNRVFPIAQKVKPNDLPLPQDCCEAGVGLVSVAESWSPLLKAAGRHWCKSSHSDRR